MQPTTFDEHLAYITGAALGDGNLSNPSGRAVRLRITCDTRYPKLIDRFVSSTKIILPNNRVSLINTSPTHVNISCYSNNWEKWLGWRATAGTKIEQNAGISDWIFSNPRYQLFCLRGLIETDGSIYSDRGYTMVNFVSATPRLAQEVYSIIKNLNYEPRLYRVSSKHRDKYTVRVARNTSQFIAHIGLEKERVAYTSVVKLDQQSATQQA